MMRSFYQSITGMKAMSDGLSVSGNNIANSKTTGFKSSRADFEDLFYQQFSAASSASGNYAGKNPVEIGNGVRMKSISVDLSQGSVVYTGRKTDVAINGDGYFALGDVNGQSRQYTRDGTFGLSTDNALTSASGEYVLGWNYNPNTGKLNTTGNIEPVRIHLNGVSNPVESTYASIEGNLNSSEQIGKIVGTQIPTYDTLGTRVDVEMNFIKVANNPSEYRYIATPSNNFLTSDSIEDIAFLPSLEVANQLQKGAYEFEVSAGATPGTVDISVVDPSGNVVLTKNITDSDQKVVLDDGQNEWFAIDYKSGSTGTTAVFEVGEVGNVIFDNTGRVSSVTGSGVNGTPRVEYTSLSTGQTISVDINFDGLTGLATENKVVLGDTDGFPAAILKDFDIGANGYVYGYYSDGSAQIIAQLAVATFQNPAGLQAQGENKYIESANSGNASISESGQGDAGQIIGQSLESSNVDIAKELTELMFYQQAYTANSKTIQVSREVLNQAINLIR